MLTRPFILGPHRSSDVPSQPRVSRPADTERLHRLFGPKPHRETLPRPALAPWLRRPAATVALELRGERMGGEGNLEESNESDSPQMVLVQVPDLDDYELPCGLRRSEIFTLMLRDLTPEDYDTLLKLDERVAKKTAAKLVSEISSQEAEGLDESLTCGICLAAFSGPRDADPPRSVKKLACGHIFHADCIDKWLQNYADRCPIDNQPLLQS